MSFVKLSTSRLAIIACGLLAAAICTSQATAAIIAQEDFQSYTAVVGDPGPDFGESGENGPGGWTSAWEEHDNPISSYVRSNLLPGYGKGLEIDNRDSSDSNILTRQFTAQDDDFYVGFTMRTTMDQPDGNNHTLIYFSDATTDDANDGYGAGTARNTSPNGPGFFFTRQGNNTTHTISTNQQVYGDLYDLVLKFSKSGGAADPFDQIDVWINQGTEGAPDITSTAGTAALAELSTFHVWFDPRNMDPPERGRLALDNLVVATTYDEARTLINNPVPEPSSLMLVGIGVALLACRYRRS
ncbi:PEP-CTERM sorting domain-containing protein [Aeoliella sp.]|uniref:PEP-CTERM sorting domain-containing protein n=1 Tax=Aeoliella sp. TaxID=2795800 RepID=UPI003CCB8D60